MHKEMIPAVVVGVCSHGLSIVRSLGRRGIPVYVLEANMGNPGVHTRYASIKKINDINTDSLIEDLVVFAKNKFKDVKPVLFLTNDNMVLNLSKKWDKLESYYLIGWSTTPEKIPFFLNKKNLESFARKYNFKYPESINVNTYNDLVKYTDSLDFPLIVKPSKPLSGFKVMLVQKQGELLDCLSSYRDSFPVILQQWIPGDDENIYFCAAYLDNGHVLSSFIGRKLRSHPPALGQTTAAISAEMPLVESFAEAFFNKTELSGPTSLEVKLDKESNPWIIEPTVGRTDFWLPCCITNNFDLPAFQYFYLGYKKLYGFDTPDERVWFDSEKDPSLFLRFLFDKKFKYKLYRPVFSYFDIYDLKPFYYGLKKLFPRVVASLLKRLKRGYDEK